MPLSFTHPDETGPINYIAKPPLFAGTPFSQSYAQRVIATNPIAYWIQGEAAGLTAIDQINSPAQDGTYTGVTLGQPGIGDGNTCPLFDGANDYNNIYTATFAGAFDGDTGTVLLWFRVANVGIWTDGTTRVCVNIRVDANNFVRIQKSALNNQFEWAKLSGGVGATVARLAMTTTVWQSAAITWAANSFQAYYSGNPQGVPVATGGWVGALAATRTVIGAIITTPANVWSGYLAHCAVWDRALSAAEVAALAVV